MKDPMKWYRRASLLYALGAWTVLGHFYIEFNNKIRPPVPLMTPEDDGVTVEKSRTFITETTVISKKGIRQESIRFINPFRSTKESSPESNKYDDEEIEC